MGMIWWDKLAILGEGWRAPDGGESFTKGFNLYTYPAGAGLQSPSAGA